MPRQDRLPDRPAQDGLAAGIVAFGPDPGTILPLVATVAPQVGTIFVFINALIDEPLKAELARAPKVVILDSDVNFGIGTALNVIVLGAALAGFRHVILFDQDSRPDAALVPGLLTSFEGLLATGERPAVVGPRLVAPTGEGYKSPRYFRRPGAAPRGDLTPVRYLPTSGSLVSVDAFRRIGAFRGDYFIDGIDLEWCFRAWAGGYSCWCAATIPMPHTVGQGVVGSRAWGLETPRQHGFRLETYVRNTVYGFRLPHVPWSWKLRQGAYLIIQMAVLTAASGARASLIRRLGRGVLDGLRGRLGPPDGAPRA